MTEYTSVELRQLTTAVRAKLGNPSQWATPGGYPDSIALCVVDAVFSMGVRYAGVKNVVAHYRKHRESDHANASMDGIAELLRTFDRQGGTEPWANLVGNRQRTSTRSGILKAEAVLREADVLASHAINTTADLHASVLNGAHPAIEQSWRTVPGQKSGISWSYFLMLARPPVTDDIAEAYGNSVVGVKPDRMIVRFVSGANINGSGNVARDKAAALVRGAAADIGVQPVVLDHAIWRYQSGRRHTRGDSHIARQK